jgi:hypothetical protein
MGTAWERHGMCELAFSVRLLVTVLLNDCFHIGLLRSLAKTCVKLPEHFISRGSDSVDTPLIP